MIIIPDGTVIGVAEELEGHYGYDELCRMALHAMYPSVTFMKRRFIEFMQKNPTIPVHDVTAEVQYSAVQRHTAEEIIDALENMIHN